MRSIGVFGGTFDPIHRGHLDTVQELRARLELDRVLLIPVATPPHRETPQADAHQRMEMLSLALRGLPGEFVADDRELRRGGVSYTVLTLLELREENPNARLVLIVGLDAWSGLPQWHRASEITALAEVAVMFRPGFELPPDVGDRDDVRFVPVTPSAVSGSEIRERIARGESVGEAMLPAEVWSFIRKQRLYGYRENARSSTHATAR